MSFETSNPALGVLRCPMCGNDAATVHRAKGAAKRLYYRCYDGGRMVCGTIQPQGPAGQQFLRERTRFHALESKDAAADAAADVAREGAREAISEERRRTEKKKRGGLLAAFLSEEE